MDDSPKGLCLSERDRHKKTAIVRSPVPEQLSEPFGTIERVTPVPRRIIAAGGQSWLSGHGTRVLSPGLRLKLSLGLKLGLRCGVVVWVQIWVVVGVEVGVRVMARVR